MILSDQPGRVIAIVILSPSFLIFGILLVKSNNIKIRQIIGYILSLFSVIFFFYELFWVINYPAKMVKI
jgi:hypothetical protein